MKKMIMTLAIAVSTLSVFAGEEAVNSKVLDAFKKEFTTAKGVEWEAGDNYYKATFTYNDKYVFAFYNYDGELLGLTRYISSVDLPLNLQMNLKKDYADYWISDLFEVAKQESTSYYLTLENADTKLIIKATDGNNWTVHQKVKKS
jgi:hypothetical protein